MLSVRRFTIAERGTIMNVSDLHRSGDLKRKYRPCVTVRDEYGDVYTISRVARESLSATHPGKCWKVWIVGRAEPISSINPRIEVLKIGERP